MATEPNTITESTTSYSTGTFFSSLALGDSSPSQCVGLYERIDFVCEHVQMSAAIHFIWACIRADVAHVGRGGTILESI
jgi:hypothetical protein